MDRIAPAELLKRTAALKDTFERNFESPWFFALLEGLPIDPLLVKDIRDFFKIDEAWAATETRAQEGIHNLELFVLTLKNYLLPCIKEKLRISPLRPEMMVTDKDQKAIRALIAYAMPLKIALLDEQIKSFKKFLDGSCGVENPGNASTLSNSLSNVSA